MTNITDKNSFVLYCDIRQALELLNDAQRGQLFIAIIDYVEHGVIPDFEGAPQMAFTFIRMSLDRDAEKWAETRRQRVIAGQKGGIESGKARQQKADEANETLA